MLATLKGLPLAYNRDLQEDKEPLFDAVETLGLTLLALSGLLDAAVFDVARMRAAADVAVSSATDLAEHLVRSGMPFREAHAVVGRAGPPVHRAPHPTRGAGRGRAAPRRGRAWGCSSRAPRCAGVRRRAAPGPGPVAVQLEVAKERLARQQRWLDD